MNEIAKKRHKYIDNKTHIYYYVCNTEKIVKVTYKAK